MSEVYKPVIKNLSDLREDVRIHDYMQWEEYSINYRTKLKSIPFSWIIGLVWTFGCGKTTFVNQLKEDGEWWINFEAWKYPERKDLWENFILETATQIWEKDFKEIEKIVDGKQHNDIRTLFKILNLIPIVKDLWGEAVSKGIDHFFAPAPLTRVYQFQNLLANIFLEKIKYHDVIFIIIEDIDRSGDHGVYFLETLNFFLKNLELPEGKRILAIATIWSKEFLENKESYLKALDHIHHFPVKKFNFKTIVQHFVDDGVGYNPVIDRFNYLWERFKDQFTIRDVKHILREANLILEKNGKWLNFLNISRYFCTLIGFLTAKYIFTEQNGKRISYLDLWKSNNGIIEWDFFQSYFLSILQSRGFLEEGFDWNLNLRKVELDGGDEICFIFENIGLDHCLIFSKTSEKSTSEKKIMKIVLNSDLLIM